MDFTKIAVQIGALIAAVAAFMGWALDIEAINAFLTAKAVALGAVWMAVQSFLPSVQDLWTKIKGGGE